MLFYFNISFNRTHEFTPLKSFKHKIIRAEKSVEVVVKVILLFNGNPRCRKNEGNCREYEKVCIKFFA